MGRVRLNGDDDFKDIGDERARIRPPSRKRVTMRPGDQRGFIHKKILGGISSLAGVASSVGIPGAGFVSGLAGALSGRGGGARFAGSRGFTTGRTVPRAQTARVTPFSQAEKELGRSLKFPDAAPVTSVVRSASIVAQGPCADPALIRASDGHCVAPGSGHALKHGVGGAVAGAVGEAMMGRFGAGMVPGSMMVDRAVCLRGMQLGIDGLCYNKGQITNKQRMWPRGRRPLLTGGDMRAIGIAARAGSKLERTTTRLRGLGLMKALPKPRKAHAHAKRATGVVSV